MPFYDESGVEIHPDFVPIPDLCRACKTDDNLERYIFCEMRRIQMREDDVFICFHFEPKTADINKDELFRHFNEIIALRKEKEENR